MGSKVTELSRSFTDTGPNADNLRPVRQAVTFDAERGDLEAAAGVRVRGDEEEAVADGKGGNV